MAAGPGQPRQLITEQRQFDLQACLPSCGRELQKYRESVRCDRRLWFRAASSMFRAWPGDSSSSTITTPTSSARTARRSSSIFPFADVCCRIGPGAVLNGLTDNARAGGDCQFAQFHPSSHRRCRLRIAASFFNSCRGAAEGFVRAGARLACAVVTVEMACLKISCSWLLASSTTEYLSNPLIFPISRTPPSRNIVTSILSRRIVLRYTS